MAERFVFRLETVLRLRRQEFERKQRAVAATLRAIGQEQSTIAATRARMEEEARCSRRTRAGGLLDVAALQAFHAQSRFLEGRIAACQERIGRHERELEHQRREMIRASVAVKTVEKLRERQWARFLAQREKHEAAEQDECALRMYRREEEAPGPMVKGAVAESADPFARAKSTFRSSVDPTGGTDHTPKA